MTPTTYYKATQIDGTDFKFGTIDYGAALLSGDVVRHEAAQKVRNDASTYLSVSVEPADCTGFNWPCRLFRVKPVGRVMANLSASPNKRAVSALRVVEELPAHRAFGPNGEHVAAFIAACATLTADDWLRVATARYVARTARYVARTAAWDVAWTAAWDVAWTVWDVARSAAWAAARPAAWDASRAAAWDVARTAAWYASGAILVRDLIAAEQYAALTQPFVDAGFDAMVGR